MDLIEAGKICRDSGFNWGRGSWWGSQELLMKISYYPMCCSDRKVSFGSDFIPDLSKGATRGVILDWAREMTGIPDVTVGRLCFSSYSVWVVQFETDKKCRFDGLDFETDTEIECYAKLCQWVKENPR